MKKKVLYKIALTIMLFVNFVSKTNAQIKMGDNVNSINASSLLELESTTKGLLFIRMNSSQMNAITAVKGLVVFNTDSNCLFNYSGTSWVSLCRTTPNPSLSFSQTGTTRSIGLSTGNTIYFSVADNDSSTVNELQTLSISPGKGTISLSNSGGTIKIDTSAWSTNGNSITSSSTKYLGTSNNSDLVLRTNGTERMRIDSFTGNIGINTNNPLTSLSIHGGLSFGDCDSISVTVDDQAVTVGNNSTIFLTSTSGTAANRTIVLSDGLVMGQILVIINIDRDATDGTQIPDNNNTKIATAFSMGKDDTITLMWNGLDWIELSRSNN